MFKDLTTPPTHSHIIVDLIGLTRFPLTIHNPQPLDRIMTSGNLPQMQYRFLGRSGLQVSAVSLGGWITYGGHVDSGQYL